jgi:flagellar biosynthesis/type III secretory pathway chaperone
MTGFPEALNTLLDQYIGRYQELAQLLNDEQAALVKLDTDHIQQIAKTKETLVLKIKLLAEPLAECLTEVGRNHGLEQEELPTLAELARVTPRPWSEKLQKAGFALARLKRSVSAHNHANQRFVTEAIELISGSISILTGAASIPKGGYLPSGRQQAPGVHHGPLRLSREV